MELRDHQIKAIEMIRESFKQGNRRVMLAACCSFGKTITAAYMMKCAAESRRVIFLADRVKLVEQTMTAFEAMGLDFGVIQADHWRTDPSKADPDRIDPNDRQTQTTARVRLRYRRRSAYAVESRH